MNFNEKSLRKHKIIEICNLFKNDEIFLHFLKNRNVHFYFDFFAFDFTEIVALHQNYLFLVSVNAFESL